MSVFVQIARVLVAGLGACLLGVIGVFLGSKLSRFRRHKKSEEIQTVFSNHHLD